MTPHEGRNQLMLVRLYGQKLGHGSLAVVTRGFEGELRRSGLLKGVYAVDLAASYVDGECPTDGADARHGVYVGPLGSVGQMFEQGHHEHHFVMVTPNSDQLPQALVRQLKGYQEKFSVRWMAPSSWAAGIVRGFLGGCWVVTHGVSSEYAPIPGFNEQTRDDYLSGAFRVIHFSTSARQRKGTIELLQAWRLAERIWANGAVLLCVMDYPAKDALEEAIADGNIPNWKDLISSVRIVQRAELDASQMARTLCRAHVVCQPSRGEGFGLIPLQALCCGVPVVATTATGHSEYLLSDWHRVPGVRTVPTGDLAPIDDLPGSRAPSLDPHEIARALGEARADWLQMKSRLLVNAPMWQANWSWQSRLEKFMQALSSP